MLNLDIKAYKLTSFQEGMLMCCEEHKKITDYVIQNVVDIEGEIQVSLLRDALKLLALKHEILVSNVFYDDCYIPRLVINSSTSIDLDEISLVNIDQNEIESIIDKIIEEDQNRGFIISEGLLFRVKILVLNQRHSKLLFTYHHIILDSNSIPIICRDLFKFYEQRKKTSDIDQLIYEIEANKGQSTFETYVKWAGSKDTKGQLEYWKTTLEGYDSSSGILPLRENKPQYSAFIQQTLEINESTVLKLKRMSEELHVSLATVLKTAWAKLLSIHNNSRDIILGNVISGRDIDYIGIKDIVGVFIKTLPLRVKFHVNASMKDIILQIAKNEKESLMNADCALSEIIALTEQKKDLFHTIFVYEENFVADFHNEEYQELQLKIERRNPKTEYDINVSACLYENGLKIMILYNSQKYVQEGIECLTEQFNQILLQTIANPLQSIDEINYICNSEQNKIINLFNTKVKEIDNNKSIVSLFETQTECNGQSVAVILEKNMLTYVELNEKANQIADILLKSGVQKGDKVALIAQRSIEMIIAIFGILKIGAIYVPIDPTYPEERKAYILSDCKPKMIIQYDTTVKSEIPCLDLPSHDKLVQESYNPDIAIDASNLAYIIYTSGTTGKPKGVMISHRGVVSLQTHFQSSYGINERDRVAQFANLVFDASIWEITMALLNGAGLVIIPDYIKEDTARLANYFKEKNVSVATLPPNYYLQTEDVTLRLLITAGSESSQDVLDKVRKNQRINQYINAYGPTETTICATDWKYNKEYMKYRIIPIGKPIYNMQVYILNERRLAGILVQGEMCIGGAGIARGYLNLEHITQEKFINNPLGQGMLYRTGDMARWLPDGTIEYLGRIDQQVKIRGYRIELGEIETNLRKLDEVDDVAVVIKESRITGKVICAYFVSKLDVSFDGIKSKIGKNLPDYMMPSYFRKVDFIPINQNGKVDVRLLPFEEYKKEAVFIAPRSIQEKVLCDVLEKMFEQENIGIHDSFSALGGDSIKAIRLVSQLRMKGYEITVRDILSCNTVELIADSMKRLNPQYEYEQGAVTGKIKSTPMLKEYQNWSLQRSEYFNQDVRFNADTDQEDLIQEVLYQVVMHHDILRAVYVGNELTILDETHQPIYEFNLFQYKQRLEFDDEMCDECTKIQASMNLEKGPLFKTALFQLKNNNILFLCAHHLVIDGISWRIIIDDIRTGIEQKLQGRKITFPKKTASFQMWSEVLEEYRKTKQLANEKKYWDKIISHIKEKKQGALSENNDGNNLVDCLDMQLDRTITEKLMYDSGKAFGTNVYSLLIAAFGMTYAKFDDQNDLVLMLESHGREELHKRIEIDRTVGWFTSTYPLIIHYKNHIDEAIIDTKEQLEHIPKHGIGYGLLNESIESMNDKIYFNYLGQMDEDESAEIHFNCTGRRSAVENGIIGCMAVSVVVINHVLRITINFRRDCYLKDKQQEIIQLYKSNLIQIIQYSSSQTKIVKTPSDYTAKELSLKDYQNIYERVEMLGEIKDIFSLNPMQEGLLFEYQKNACKTEYVIQLTAGLSGSIQERLLHKAIQLCVARHDALRIRIITDGIEKARQVILKDIEVEYQSIDITKKEDPEKSFIRLCKEDIDRGFELSKENLFRTKYVKTGKEQGKLILTFHHIILDGWSQSIIFDSIREYYEMLIQGIQYDELKEKILSQNEVMPNYCNYLKRIENVDREEGLEYWQSVMEACDEVCTIKPIEQPQEDSSHVAVESFVLSKEDSEGLYRNSTEHAITMSTLCETAWGIVLQKYNAAKEIVFGKVVSGREINIDHIERYAGLFINTIPVRVSITDHMTIQEILQIMKQQDMDSMTYSYNLLADIQQMSAVKKNLIQTLFVFENNMDEELESQKESHLHFDEIKTREQTEYNITILARVKNKILSFDIMYNPNKYSEIDIKRLGLRYQQIIKQLKDDWEREVNTISMLIENEESQLKRMDQLSSYEAIGSKTVIEVFEERVFIQPKAIFAKDQSREITYEQFNEKVNQIAWRLRKIGVQPNSFVAIIAERSIEMLIGIYGIIKSGAAYVPIEPHCPSERIRYMIEDCQPKAILLYQCHIDTSIPCIDLEQQSILEEPINNLPVVNKAEDRLYMIYTSGTTGNPKGVINKHIGIINLFQWLVKEYSIIREDIFLFKTTYIFDVSVSEILMPVFTGLKLIVAPNNAEKDPVLLTELMNQHHVTLIDFVPSMLSVFLQYVKSFKDIKSIRYVFAAGEALNLSLIQQYYELVDMSKITGKLINLYGPTESSIYATYCTCERDMLRSFIGKPIGNTQIYIEQQGQLCGIGIPGELCIAGIGVAEGYLNQEVLTKSKFIENTKENTIVYHTGDLARWMPGENIEYLGRIDDQVKVRGFRIEISEIESRMRGITDVKDVAVIVRKHAGNQSILAYFTSNRAIEASYIKDCLAKSLPEYMIPAGILQLASIPVTANGKLDRCSLPDIVNQSQEQEITLPRNEIEYQLYSFYEGILQTSGFGIDTNFFALGGHSISAMRLLNLIMTKISKQVTMVDLFTKQTIRQLAEYISKLNLAVQESLPEVSERELYLMSPAQKRIYIVSQISSTGCLYNVSFGYKLKGRVNSDRVLEVLNEMTQRHEILRTVFLMKDNEFYQKVCEHVEIDYTYENNTDLNDNEIMDQFVQPFQLDRGPLFRTKSVKQSNDEYLLLFSMHHIISDGITLNIFLREFSTLYQGGTLEDIKVQYKQYSEWMNHLDMSELKNYWLSAIGEDIPVLNFPLDYQRPAVQSHRGRIIHREINGAIEKQIRHLSKLTGTTEFMIFMATLSLLLSKYSNQEEIIVGTPISGRNHKDTESMLGVFINTIPIKVNVKKEDTFLEFLEKVKKTCYEAYEHQEYPYEKLVEELHIERDFSRNPLFDVILTYHTKQQFQLQLKDISASMLEQTSILSKYDFDFTIMDFGNRYKISLEYCVDLFSDDNADRILNNYIQLIEEATKEFENKLYQISFLTKEDEKQIFKWNQTSVEDSMEFMPIEYISQAAMQYPDRIAVVYEGDILTFGELDRRAKILATKLQNQGVEVNDCVAVIAERSTEMVIAICGILMVQAAYVPIDTTYPSDRVHSILEDCKPKACLVYKYHDLNLNYIIDLENTNLWQEESQVKQYTAKAQDLVYCIYTSGTTGKPKGVMVEQHGLINLYKHFIEPLFVQHEIKQVALMATYAFDSSVKMIFGALMSGRTLHIISNERKDSIQSLLKYLNQYQIDVIDFTPVYLRIVQSEALIHHGNLGLKIILAGGEALKGKDITFMKLNPQLNIYNVYGPTEATVDTTVYHCTGNEKNAIPIGHPIPNAAIYVVRDGALCGIGVPGELCIGGVGLARGYLNQPELTSQKFIPNPFGEGKIYRTGDLVRWNGEGLLEFLGRMDDQVKISGYRIEIEEIVQVLKEISSIQDAVVLMTIETDGSKALCAYIMASQILDMDVVKNELLLALPNYMVPAKMIQIDKIPMTSNGKVDKKKLRSIKSRKKESVYQEPTDEIQKVLCNVFEDVLHESSVGILDSFYELGGDSIKAIIITSRLKNLGYQVTVRDIMSQYTIQSISKCVIKENHENYDQSELTGYVTQTPILEDFKQRHLYRAEQFCQDIMLNVGQLTEIEIEKILNTLVRHHDILRSIYQQDRLFIQPIDKAKAYELSVMRLDDEMNHLEIVKACEKVQQSFNLSHGPLVKAILFQGQKKNQLFLCIHHLVIDGVSWRILQEDIEQVCQQIQEGKEIKLSAKTASYEAWAQALNEFKESDLFQREQEYWSHIDRIKSTDFLEVRNDKQNPYPEVESITVELSREKTNYLLREANRAYGTTSMDLLISALTRAVRKVFLQDTITVGLEGHGREEIHKPIDITRTVGWFTTKYPVVIACEEDIVQSIINVKDQIHRVPRHGLGYGLINKMKQERLADIYLNYLGQMDDNIKFCEISKTSIQDNGILGMIDINAIVNQGELQVTFAYNSSILLKETMDQFSQVYIQELTTLIDYCRLQKASIRTASDYVAEDLDNGEIKKIVEYFQEEEVEDIYPLMPIQEGMLYYKLSEQDSSAYIIQIVCNVLQPIYFEVFKSAIERVMLKYPILRTAYYYEKAKQPRQVVLTNREVECDKIDYRFVKDNEGQYLLDEVRSSEVERGFDLQKDTLIRFKYVELPKEQCKLIITHDHIILDGWCIPILLRAIEEAYHDILEGERLLNHSNRTSKDTFMQYLSSFKSQNMKSTYDYWEHLIGDYEGGGKIKALVIEKASTGHESIKQDYALSETISKEIKNFTAKLGITNSTIFETAWGLLLLMHNGSKDIVFGKVVSGRNIDLDRVEDAMGIFINTIPVRMKLNNDSTVAMLLHYMSQQANESMEYSNASLAEIQKRCRVKEQLIQTLYVYENYYGMQEQLTMKNASMLQLEAAREQTNYDLTISVYYDENSEQFHVGMMYSSEFHCKRDVDWIIKQYENILQSLLRENELTIPIVMEEEKTLLHEFNHTEMPYENQMAIMEVFEQQVKNNQDKVAVICKNQRLTYGQLNKDTNRLAHTLLELGVGREDFVMIMGEKSIETIIGICAILKAGAAYVPIDPNYPDDRIQYMIEDCKPKALLTYNRNITTKVPTISLKEICNMVGCECNPECENTGEDLAYVIYTSGTMGHPKGSLVRNQSILRLTRNTNYVELNEKSVILQTGSLAFDASTFEIWGALLNGGQLVLAEDEIITSCEMLKQYIEDYSVNTMWLTASLYNQMVQMDVTIFDQLTYLLIGGEKLSDKHVKILKDHNKQIKLINGYGPTENTTFTTTYEIPDDFQKIYIGQPIVNTQVYVMNEKRLCGIGMPGQLCIAGDGVARGYLNQPDLTKQKFIKNPFGEGKLYLSGDLVRWTLDGNIDFIGRIDAQIKIRGFRIEISEIEQLMKQLEKVEDGCIIAKEDASGEKELYAYMTSKDKLSLNEIRQSLRKQLPEYMIPAYMLQIDTMPLTIQGKIDKQALPNIMKRSEDKYIVPTNEKEYILCTVLEEILEVNQVGTKDNYFLLGGDSIKAIRVVSKMRNYGYEVSVKDIMMFATVELIAQVTKKLKEDLAYEQGDVAGVVPSTPILDVFEQWNLKKPSHFNQDILMEISSSDIDKIEPILETLVHQHDILRSVYRNHRLIIIQQSIRKGYEYTIYDDQNGDFDLNQECTRIQGSIDLENGSLMKAALFKMQNKNQLFICIHHLVIDNVSWQILIEDIETALDCLRKKSTIILPKKTASYIEWANALIEYGQSNEIQQQRDYWSSITSRAQHGELVLEKLGHGSGYNTCEVHLDVDTTEQLIRQASQAYNTRINDLLISALSLAVKRITNQSELSILMEGHGREEIHKRIDIDRTVGWFTSMYPIVLNCFNEVEETIIHTKETLRRLPNHGIGYGLLQEEYPLPYITLSFNYLGQIDNIEQNQGILFFSTGNSISEENKVLTDISITASAVKGSYITRFNFDQAVFTKEQINLLAQQYIEALEEIIKFCISREKNTKTVSDMYSEDISEEDLKNINLFF